MTTNTVHVPADLSDMFSAASGALATTTAETLARLATAGEGVVVLADCSGSMQDPSGINGKSRLEVLREALNPLRGLARVVAFAEETREVLKGQRLPEPGVTAGWNCGWTQAHKAIRHAATTRPARTVLICDGEVDQIDDCLDAVASLPGVLDCIFVGNPRDLRAVAALRRLAEAGGGTFQDMSSAMAELPAAVECLMLTA